MDINSKLKEIDIENFIWTIYIFIILLSFYSNKLEKKYYVLNDLISKEKYRKINIFIFSVLFIIYVYFFKNSYNSIKDLKESDSKKKKELITLSFLASLLLTISSAIYLIIALNNEELDVELAFN